MQIRADPGDPCFVYGKIWDRRNIPQIFDQWRLT